MWSYSAICSCVCWLFWLICQYLPSDWLWKDPSDDTFMRWGDYLHKAQVEEHFCLYFSFVWFVYIAMCSPTHPCGPTQYIFHTPMAQYSLYLLKVPLDTKQTKFCCIFKMFTCYAKNINNAWPTCPVLSCLALSWVILDPRVDCTVDGSSFSTQFCFTLHSVIFLEWFLSIL